MTASTPFHGLSAFPITPTNNEGRVDTEALGRLLDRLCNAGVDSIGLLGSTGTYAYLSRDERRRAVEAGVECVAGRVPLIVGVGALRTDHARELARDAFAARADALLMAPVSYTPLMQDEVFEHFRSVADATDLPLCIYNNPGTTHFTFTPDLLVRLADLETVRGVKMPATSGIAEELAFLRARTDLSIGYSGDWIMADAMLAGADAFYSVLGGLLPAPVLRLVRSAQAGNVTETQFLDQRLTPLWDAFKAYGSLRVMYALLERLDFEPVAPPLPILPLGPEARARIALAAEPFLEAEMDWLPARDQE